MTTNKERIEHVEVELGSLLYGMKRIKLGLNDRLHRLEKTINKKADSISASRGTASHNNYDQVRSSQPNRGENKRSRQQFASRDTKLKCPQYSDDDPMEWYNRITQFFKYQEATDKQKISLASFHLE